MNPNFDPEEANIGRITPKLVGPAAYYDAVYELWASGMPSGAKTGWKALDAHYTVAPGQMTIVTGWPGSGKSEWLDHLLINLSGQGWKFAVFSAENQPIELHLAKLMEKLSGYPFRDGPSQRIKPEEIGIYLAELTLAFRFIPTTEDSVSLQDIVKEAHPWLMQNDGRKPGLIIDPWNELDHGRPKNKTETEYISESLSYVRNWARANGVHVWIVAHPAKQTREEGALPIPKPDMISGSQHWWNKADCALTVYRQPVDEGSAFHNQVEIHIQKIRFKNIGKVGKVTLQYNRTNGRYSE